MAFDLDGGDPVCGTLTLLFDLPDEATRRAFADDALAVMRDALAGYDPAVLAASPRPEATKLHADLRAQLDATRALVEGWRGAVGRGDSGSADRLFRELVIARWSGRAHIAALRIAVGDMVGPPFVVLAEVELEGGSTLRLVAQTGHSRAVSALGFSADGRQVISAGDDGRMITWDAASGMEIDAVPASRKLPPNVGPGDPSLLSRPVIVAALAGIIDPARLACASPSIEAPLVVIGFASGALRAIDPTSGQVAWSAPAMRLAPRQIAIGAEGQRFIVTGEDDSIYDWDAVAGRLAAVRVGPEPARGDAIRVESSFAGQILRRGEHGEAIGYYEPRETNALVAAEVSASGARVLLFHEDGSTCVLDARKTPDAWLAPIDIDAAAPDIRWRARLVQTAVVALSPDGRWALAGGRDGVLHARDLDRGAWLFHALAFPDGRWVVADDEGRFDASDGGEAAGLHWVLDTEPIALTQLKDRYYDPFLLAKKLGHNPEELRAVVKLAPTLAPAATVTPDPSSTVGAAFRVVLTDRGGGLGPVRVSLNCKEAFICTIEEAADGAVRVRVDNGRWWAAEAHRDDAGKLVEVAFTIPVAGNALVMRRKRNHVEVVTTDSARMLSGRAVTMAWVDPPQETGSVAESRPHLWAIVVGVSRYAGPGLQLRYAAKDAEDFAAALEVAALSLFGKERVHVTTLTSERGEATQPTRAHIEAAFQAARAARSGDVLVAYLAGHGAKFTVGDDEDFLYLTQDATGDELDNPEARRRGAASGAELTTWIKQIPALKQVLVLDTCHAGQILTDLSRSRDLAKKQAVPSGHVRAIERMKDRAGLFVLAGASADAVSYEATRYAQGLLTYALLFGMRGAALREGKLVDVSQLFNHAVDQVPTLAEGIGGVQRPLLAVPSGAASFDIGELAGEARERIPLALELPLVVQASFQDEDEIDDTSKLGEAVNEVLRGAAKLVFVGANEFPGAYRLVGRYQRREGQVEVTARLKRGKEPAVTIAVQGKDDAAGWVKEIATRLVAEAAARMKAG